MLMTLKPKAVFASNTKPDHLDKKEMGDYCCACSGSKLNST